MSKKFECVRVVIRCRPLNEIEKKDGRVCIVNMDTESGQVFVRNPKVVDEIQQQFTFDQIFDTQSQQEQVYNATASPIVENVFEGYNCTIFAYGQTGSGKTHTMEGQEDPSTLRGIIPRTFDQIFQRIENMSKNKQFLVKVSFLELYNEQFRDLLAKNVKNKLDIRENPVTGVYIKDLSKYMIESPIQMREKFLRGRENRAQGATAMNYDSSRSHSLFSITIETNEMIYGYSHVTVGKLNLVDLAGSERQSQTHVAGERLKEAININLSLTTLGNVISALVDNKSQHIPYRDSKLTRLLQNSLGGNTKTVMIINIGPADYNYNETILKLRYAHRAKQIKNKPKINVDPIDAQIRQFQAEIMKLKSQLEALIEDGDGLSVGSGQVVLVQKVVKVKNEYKIKEAENIIEREKEELKKKMEEESRKIEQQQNLGEEEKMKLLRQLQEKDEKASAARQQQQKLIKTIQKMEQKLVIGHTEVEEARRKEKELKEARKMIEKEKAEAAKHALELQKKEDFNIEFQTKFSSIKEELEDQTRRINTLQQKIRQMEVENKEADEFMAKEIEDIQIRRRDIILQVKLKQLILNYFIPPKFLKTMQMLSMYNEAAEAWTIQGIEYCGKLIKTQIQEAIKEQQQLQMEIINEEKIQELINHPNVYFAYTEEGLVREEELAPQDKEKFLKLLQTAKKQKSAKLRPKSKCIESAKKSTSL